MSGGAAVPEELAAAATAAAAVARMSSTVAAAEAEAEAEEAVAAVVAQVEVAARQPETTPVEEALAARELADRVAVEDVAALAADWDGAGRLATCRGKARMSCPC